MQPNRVEAKQGRAAWGPTAISQLREYSEPLDYNTQYLCHVLYGSSASFSASLGCLRFSQRAPGAFGWS